MISVRGLVVVVILRFPHLVLADVGDDDGFAVGFFPEIVDDVSGVEMAGVGKALNVANGGIALQFRDVAEPVGAVVLFDYAGAVVRELREHRRRERRPP